MQNIKKHDVFGSGKFFIRFAIAIVIYCVILLAGASYAANSSASPTIKTSVILQPSNGLTENDFSMQMLSAIEEWSKARVLKNAKKSFALQGFPANQFKADVKSESNYLSMSGKKLGVVYVSIFLEESDQTTMKMVRVFGFVDEGIATVSCIRQSDEKIPITFGICGEKIKEIFNLSY